MCTGEWEITRELEITGEWEIVFECAGCCTTSCTVWPADRWVLSNSGISDMPRQHSTHVLVIVPLEEVTFNQVHALVGAKRWILTINVYNPDSLTRIAGPRHVIGSFNRTRLSDKSAAVVDVCSLRFGMCFVLFPTPEPVGAFQ
jgi:hypothetical protein